MRKLKKKVNSPKKKPIYDGITFDSGLEVYCYKALKKPDYNLNIQKKHLY